MGCAGTHSESHREAAARPAACASLHAVRTALVTNASRQRQLVCADDESVPSFSTDGSGAHYDRQGRMVCEGARLVAHAPYTVFALSTAKWAAEIASFPQHTLLLLYMDSGAERTQLYQLFPNSYGRWDVGERHERNDLKASLKIGTRIT